MNLKSLVVCTFIVLSSACQMRQFSANGQVEWMFSEPPITNRSCRGLTLFRLSEAASKAPEKHAYVNEALARQFQNLKPCMLAKDPTSKLGAKVYVRIGLGAGGCVHQVWISAMPADLKNMQQCFINTLFGWRFPKILETSVTTLRFDLEI